jgi:hypothetical protein
VVVYPGWDWWASYAPAWGAVTLSPTVVIQTSVNQAVSANRETVQVPDSDFQIFYASIQPLSEDVIEFSFEYDNEVYDAKADCKAGLLNDEPPSAIEEAELMHSACTIAFADLA